MDGRQEVVLLFGGSVSRSSTIKNCKSCNNASKFGGVPVTIFAASSSAGPRTVGLKPLSESCGAAAERPVDGRSWAEANSPTEAVAARVIVLSVSVQTNWKLRKLCKPFVYLVLPCCFTLVPVPFYCACFWDQVPLPHRKEQGGANQCQCFVQSGFLAKTEETVVCVVQLMNALLQLLELSLLWQNLVECFMFCCAC
jgi:hypothetical protein